MKFKEQKISLLFSIIFVLIFSVITFAITAWYKNNQISSLSSLPNDYYCKIDIKRLTNQKYIKPILLVEDECESSDLIGIKQKVSEIINNAKVSDGVKEASVYVKDLSNSDWTSVNNEQNYDPGSLFKVPILIAILEKSEENSGLLEKKIKFEKIYNDEKKKAYPPLKSIQVGNTYTVKELLSYMIKYSDNNATLLLEEKLNIANSLNNVFSALNLQIPDSKADHYYFKVKEYSLLLRTIYNAGYLTIQDSEFAAELLTECQFKDGISKGLPKNVELAHKFGESGDDNERQLHESAIIFLKNKPYLLTIMTKGKDLSTLSNLISKVSNTVYVEMLNNSN